RRGASPPPPRPCRWCCRRTTRRRGSRAPWRAWRASTTPAPSSSWSWTTAPPTPRRPSPAVRGQPPPFPAGARNRAQPALRPQGERRDGRGGGRARRGDRHHRRRLQLLARLGERPGEALHARRGDGVRLRRDPAARAAVAPDAVLAPVRGGRLVLAHARVALAAAPRLRLRVVGEQPGLPAPGVRGRGRLRGDGPGTFRRRGPPGAALGRAAGGAGGLHRRARG